MACFAELRRRVNIMGFIRMGLGVFFYKNTKAVLSIRNYKWCQRLVSQCLVEPFCSRYLLQSKRCSIKAICFTTLTGATHRKSLGTWKERRLRRKLPYYCKKQQYTSLTVKRKYVSVHQTINSHATSFKLRYYGLSPNQITSISIVESH